MKNEFNAVIRNDGKLVYIMIGKELYTIPSETFQTYGVGNKLCSEMKLDLDLNFELLKHYVRCASNSLFDCVMNIPTTSLSQSLFKNEVIDSLTIYKNRAIRDIDLAEHGLLDGK